jgi:hypothetical protein
MLYPKMWLRVLYDKQDVFDKKPVPCETMCNVADDLELGFFMKEFCDMHDFDFDEHVFFWWPENGRVVQLESDNTAPGMGMERGKTQTVDFFQVSPDKPSAKKATARRQEDPADKPTPKKAKANTQP